jgi:hypothetical protein
MNQDQREFLTVLRQPPARLTTEQAAWLLNCNAHDIPILVARGLLKPLGSPRQNGTKYFATGEVLELAGRRSWLASMTSRLQEHWQEKNRRKNGHTASQLVNGRPPRVNGRANGRMQPAYGAPEEQ